MLKNRGLLKMAALGAVFAGMAAMADAQSDPAGVSSYRAEKWDFTLGMKYALETDVSGQGGSTVEVNDDLGFGFGAGYNFNDYFQLGGSFNWDSRSYDAAGVGDDGLLRQYNSDLESAVIALNAILYLLPGNVSPFVSGSLGYTFIDTNIQNGPAQEVCYWDPWWGYVCDSYVPTRSESGLSYGAGVGLRADVNEAFSLQLSYNKAWIDIDNASGTPDFDSVRVDFIFRNF